MKASQFSGNEAAQLIIASFGTLRFIAGLSVTVSSKLTKISSFLHTMYYN